MRIEIHVNPAAATQFEFAEVTLRCEALNVASVLDLEFSTLYDRCHIPTPITLDFLFLASVVYGVDKLVSRRAADDRWTRTLDLTLPVSDTEKWCAVTDELQTCLSFLTGDIWTIGFTDLPSDLHRPKLRKRPRRNAPSRAAANTVCLFSGGLDSLIGAIDALESSPTDKVFLVGHQDRYAKTKSDQNRLDTILKKQYQSQFDLLQVRIGPKPLKIGSKRASQENTLRSRSFLFIALGVYAARSIGEQVPLLLPENGAIALNVPMTPSRRGSCSTRTAHPFFLQTLRKMFTKLGIENALCNPLGMKTKGECVAQCRNQRLLRAAAKESVSCAKRGHNATWHNRNARGCGRCLPCIYRRASLHKVGWDTENYGRDICTGEVDLASDKTLADDLRALVSFLRRDVSREEIATLLLANGHLDRTRLPAYADVVARSTDEVRAWLRDKGPDDIRQRAGLGS